MYDMKTVLGFFHIRFISKAGSRFACQYTPRP
jgi:hypothetical protein